MKEGTSQVCLPFKCLTQNSNAMRLTITTLVIVEDIHDPQSDDMSICYHSFKEDPEAAKSELISDVNALYAPSIVFNSIEEIQEYFEYVHLESQEIQFVQTTTAIKEL